MKHIADALVEALDLPQFRQPPAEQPHCCQRQADLYAAADDMGKYAEQSAPSRAPARVLGGSEA